MYNHNKAQQSKNRVHISWGILYESNIAENSKELMSRLSKWQLNRLNGFLCMSINPLVLVM